MFNQGIELQLKTGQLLSINDNGRALREEVRSRDAIKKDLAPR
jgi:hypothetical protein